jgi:hypothetical protein
MTTLARPERVPINKRAIDELVTTLRGELIRPSDAGDEQHRRVWNATARTRGSHSGTSEPNATDSARRS